MYVQTAATVQASSFFDLRPRFTSSSKWLTLTGPASDKVYCRLTDDNVHEIMKELRNNERDTEVMQADW